MVELIRICWTDIHYSHCTKMKFSIKDLFSKCDQIRRKLWIWSHLLKKSLIMENFVFYAVSVLDRKIPFLDKFSPKISVGTLTNSDVLNSMVIFNYTILHWQYFFWTSLLQKNQNCLLQLKFSIYLNSKMLNLMVMFIYFVLDRKDSFWANLVQKINIA